LFDEKLLARSSFFPLFLGFLLEGRQRLLERVKLVLEAADAPEQFVDFLDVVRLVEGQLEVLHGVLDGGEVVQLSALKVVAEEILNGFHTRKRHRCHAAPSAPCTVGTALRGGGVATIE